MSGGSHNYLYNQYYAGGMSQTDLENMAYRLLELGYDAIADDTLAQIQFREIENYIPSEKLRKVWKAVEWYDSCDWALIEVQVAADYYMQGEDLADTLYWLGRKGWKV